VNLTVDIIMFLFILS